MKSIQIIVLVVIITMAIGLRIFGINSKPMWGDEIVTLGKMYGYSAKEIKNHIMGLKAPSNLSRFKRTGTYSSYLRAMSIEGSHVPLFGTLVWGFNSVFPGVSSPNRWISVYASLITIMLIVFMCRRTCKDTRFVILVTAMVALSPMQLVYSQEGRPYALFMMFFVWASLLFLRAVSSGSQKSWFAYSVMIALESLTHLLFIFHLAVNVVFILLFKQTNKKVQLGKTILFSILGCLPLVLWKFWCLSQPGYKDLARLTGWLYSDVSWTLMVNTFLLNLSRNFYDLCEAFNYIHIPMYLGFAIVSLISLICLFRKRNVLSFYVIVTVAVHFSLILVDLLLGGKRSLITRFLLPAYLSCTIAIAYFVYDQIFCSNNVKQRVVGSVLMCVLLISGVVSSLTFVTSKTWWNKGHEFHFNKVANIIAQHKKALILGAPEDLFALSFQLSKTFKYFNPIESGNWSAVSNWPGTMFALNKKVIKEKMLDLNPSYKMSKHWRWMESNSPILISKTQLWKLENKMHPVTSNNPKNR